MSDSLSLEGKIHFYYDQSFDNIKKEVFVNWVLEYLRTDDPPLQTREHIEDFFTQKLGFAVQTSERTRVLFESSLEEVVARDWARRQQNPIDKQVDYVYVQTNKGKQRLKTLVQDRKELLDNCYREFAMLLHGQIFRQSRRGANPNESLAISQVEELFATPSTLHKYFQEYLNLISPNIARKLIKSGLKEAFLSPNEQAFIDNRKIEDLFSLGEIKDPDVRKLLARALDRATTRLSELNLPTFLNLQHWFYLKAYQQLFEQMWPDEDVQDHLIQYLNCIHVYLDTNVLVAALSKSDPLHKRSRLILNFLIKNDVKIFWLTDTEHELESHLELSKGLVRMLEHRPLHEIFDVLELSNPPSFVKSYFSSSWRSWQQFSDEIHENYYRIRNKSLYNKVEGWLSRNKDFTDARRKFVELFEEKLRSRDPQRPAPLLRHDALLLSTIHMLRVKAPTEFVSSDCRNVQKADKLSLGELFWIVSFDRKVSDITLVSEDAEANEDAFPLVLLYETILLFLDPYVVSKALRDGRGERHPTGYLPLTNMKELRSVIGKARQDSGLVKSVADYIEQYNDQMVKKFRVSSDAN